MQISCAAFCFDFIVINACGQNECAANGSSSNSRSSNMRGQNLFSFSFFRLSNLLIMIKEGYIDVVVLVYSSMHSQYLHKPRPYVFLSV